jgi:hypothetical protein
MVGKKLSRGTVGYYWQPPTWARGKGCIHRAEALGTDYAEAKRRCDEGLDPQFQAWCQGNGFSPSVCSVGTFSWMVAQYKASPKWQSLTNGTQADYDRVLESVTSHKLKDGRRFGDLALRSITPGAADRLHAQLLIGGKGNRRRTAKLAMDVCRRAWGVSYRSHPEVVPSQNPFAKMGLSYKPRTTRAATLDELTAFVATADQLGHRSIGTAALIGFYWLQREEDIFLRLAWSHFRPADASNTARIFHNKTGEIVDIPLHDEDGTELWPDLVPRLDREPRVGTLIVMRDKPDRKRNVYLPWATSASNPLRHVQRIVARIRRAAQLRTEITFTSFRHGGHTDAANAGVTDAQIRALSGHKTAAMVTLYAKETKAQRLAGETRGQENEQRKFVGIDPDALSEWRWP